MPETTLAHNNMPESHNITRNSLPTLLNLCFLLMKSGNNMLYLASLTIFLQQIGAQKLPWVYLAVNVCFITVQFGLISKIPGKEGHWLLSKLSLVSMSLSLFAGYFLQGSFGIAPIIVLVLAMLTDLNSTQAFGNMANQLLTIQETKKILPMVYASGSIGYIISGIMLKFVLDIVGIGGLLLGNAGLLFTLAMTLHILKKFESESKPLRNFQKNKITKTTEKSTLNHPLSKALMLSGFLVIFNKYLIDFLFVTAISKFFTKNTDLASFMGIFGASADLIVIGLQTFIMHRIFSKFQIGKILCIMPAILAITCALSFFKTGFVFIAIVQFLVLLNSKNFTVPATTMLLGAVPEKQRSAVRRNISISCSISSALVGAFLLIAQKYFSPKELFLCASASYFFMSFVHYRFDNAYSISLRQSLSDDNNLSLEDQLKALRLLKSDEKEKELIACLKRENNSVRLQAIEEVSLLPRDKVFDILAPLLNIETNTKCLSLIANTLLSAAPDQALSQIKVLLSETSDPRLKSDIIEALGNLHSSESIESIVEQFIADPHHRIRGSAIISMIRLTRSPTKLTLFMRALAQMASSKIAIFRSTSAAVIGELGFPLFIPALQYLTNDNDFSVAHNAIESLAKIGTTEAISTIENLAINSTPEVSEYATKVFKYASKKSIQKISRLIGNITSQERKILVQRLKAFHQDGYHEVLARILALESVPQRKILVDLLEKTDSYTFSLIDKSIVWVNTNSSRASLPNAVWSQINQSCFSQQPLLSELFRSLPLQNPKTNNLEIYSDNITNTLKEIWLIRIALEQGLIQESASTTNSKNLETAYQTGFWHKLDQHSEIVCRIFALLANDPIPLLKAIEDFKGSETFSIAIAQEYLTTQLGSKLFKLALPLLKPNEYMIKAKAKNWKELTKISNVATESEISKTFTKHQLKAFIQYGEIT